jgi:hypothetical protein
VVIVEVMVGMTVTRLVIVLVIQLPRTSHDTVNEVDGEGEGAPGKSEREVVVI